MSDHDGAEQGESPVPETRVLAIASHVVYGYAWLLNSYHLCNCLLDAFDREVKSPRALNSMHSIRHTTKRKANPWAIAARMRRTAIQAARLVVSSFHCNSLRDFANVLLVGLTTANMVIRYVGNTMATFCMQALGCEVAAINTVNFSGSFIYLEWSPHPGGPSINTLLNLCLAASYVSCERNS